MAAVRGLRLLCKVSEYTQEEIASLVEQAKQVFRVYGVRAYEHGLPLVCVRRIPVESGTSIRRIPWRAAVLLDVSECGKFLKVGPARMSSTWRYRSVGCTRWWHKDQLDIVSINHFGTKIEGPNPKGVVHEKS